MNIEATLSFGDLVRYNFRVFFTRKLYISYWLFLWLLIFLFGGAEDHNIFIRLLVSGIMIVLFFIFGWVAALILLYFRSKEGRDYGWHSFKIDENAIYEETKESKSETKWSGVIKIDKTKNYLYIFVSHSAAFIVPKRAFSNPNDFEIFHDKTYGYFSKNT